MNLQETNQSHVDSVQVVSFKVEQENYGVHIKEVQEIIRMPEVTHLPQADDYIKGIINLRGNIIPIINMRTRFHMGKKEYTDITRVIVLSIKDKLVGIIVDSVFKVLELKDVEIEDAPEIINELSKKYIEGIGKVNDNMIIILKIDEVLTAHEFNNLDGILKKTKKEEIN